MDELKAILELLKSGANDKYIAKAMKPYWKETQERREYLVSHWRRAMYHIHGHANG